MPKFQRIYWSKKFNWEEYARLYNKYCKTKDNFYINNAKILLKSVEIKDPVLEIGCGTGILSENILKQKPKTKITAIDLSKEMLFYYKQNLQKQIAASQVEPIQGNAEEIDKLVDKKFKTVFVPSAIWDLEIENFAKHISEIMKKGGLLVFNLPAIVLGESEGLIAFIENLFKESNHKYRRVQKESLIETFSKNNLILTSFKSHDFWLSKQNIIKFFALLKLRYPFICFPESMPYEEKFEKCESMLKKSAEKIPVKGLKDKIYIFVFEKT